jgi:hypothetical protein
MLHMRMQRTACTRVRCVLSAVIGNLLLADYQLIPVLLAIRYDEIRTSSLVILLVLFGLSQSRLRVGKKPQSDCACTVPALATCVIVQLNCCTVIW